MGLFALMTLLRFRIQLPDLRLSFSMTLIFIAIAYKFVTIGALPAIAYLTLLDKFVMSQTLLIVLSAFEHGFGHQEYDLIVVWVTVGLWIATHLYFAARAFAVKRLQRKQRRTRQSDRLSQRRLSRAASLYNLRTSVSGKAADAGKSDPATSVADAIADRIVHPEHLVSDAQHLVSDAAHAVEHAAHAVEDLVVHHHHHSPRARRRRALPALARPLARPREIRRQPDDAAPPSLRTPFLHRHRRPGGHGGLGGRDVACDQEEAAAAAAGPAAARQPAAAAIGAVRRRRRYTPPRARAAPRRGGRRAGESMGASGAEPKGGMWVDRECRDLAESACERRRPPPGAGPPPPSARGRCGDHRRASRERLGRPGQPPAVEPRPRRRHPAGARRRGADDDRSAAPSTMAKSTKLISAFGFLIAIGGLYKGHELLLIASHSGDSHDSAAEAAEPAARGAQSRAEPAPRPSTTTTAAPPATTTPAPSTARPPRRPPPPPPPPTAARAAGPPAIPRDHDGGVGQLPGVAVADRVLPLPEAEAAAPVLRHRRLHRLFNNVGGKPDRMMDEIPTILVTSSATGGATSATTASS